MKKNIRIVFIIITLIIGLLYLGYILTHAFEGYKGYCNYVELPFGMFINVFEVGITAFLLCFIGIKYSNNTKWNQIPKYWKVLVGILMVNLLFIVYKIGEYPRMLSYVNWGFFPDNTPKNDQHMGLDYNPLIPVYVLYSIGLIGFNIFLKSKGVKPYYTLVNWIVVGLVALVTIIVIRSIPYEMCQG